MSDPIIIHQRLSLGGFLRLLLAQFLHTPAMRRVILIPCAFGVLLMLFSLLASEADVLSALWIGLSIPLVAIASLGSFALLGSLLVWVLASRRHRNTVFTFTHWGMESSNGVKTAAKPWRTFVKAGETRRYFLLYVTPKVPLLLRKHDFADPAGIDAFRELLVDKELLPAAHRWVA